MFVADSGDPCTIDKLLRVVGGFKKYEVDLVKREVKSENLR